MALTNNQASNKILDTQNQLGRPLTQKEKRGLQIDANTLGAGEFNQDLNRILQSNTNKAFNANPNMPAGTTSATSTTLFPDQKSTLEQKLDTTKQEALVNGVAPVQGVDLSFDPAYQSAQQAKTDAANLETSKRVNYQAGLDEYQKQLQQADVRATQNVDAPYTSLYSMGREGATSSTYAGLQDAISRLHGEVRNADPQIQAYNRALAQAEDEYRQATVGNIQAKQNFATFLSNEKQNALAEQQQAANLKQQEYNNQQEILTNLVNSDAFNGMQDDEIRNAVKSFSSIPPEVSFMIARGYKTEAAKQQDNRNFSDAVNTGALANFKNPEEAKAAFPTVNPAIIDAYFKQGTTNLSNQLLQQKLQNQQTGMKIMSDSIDLGVPMTEAQVDSVSQQTGLDRSFVAGQVARAIQVQNDKKLSDEAKQLQLIQLKQEIKDRKDGLRTEADYNLRGLKKLYASGASKDEIRDYKNVHGIKDMDDPAYVAELQIKQAEADIRTKEAQGIAVTAVDKIKLLQAQQEYAQFTGQQSIQLPSGGTYSAVQAGNGISIDIKTGASAGQCGRFVNDVFGTPSLIKDSYSAKKALINSYTPVAGAAFVMSIGGKYADNGHVGIVESVNPDGTINVVESNWNGKETVTRRTIDPAAVDGYILNPNAKSMNAKNSNILNAMDAVTLGLSKAQAENTRKTITDAVNSGDESQAKSLLISAAMSSFTAEQKNKVYGRFVAVDALDKIQNDLDAFKNAGGDTGLLQGTAEQVAQKFGNTTNPEIAKLGNEIVLNIIAYRNAVSGAAFTESEQRQYESVFPSTKNVAELNKALIDSLKSTFNANNKSILGLAMGEKNYDAIFGDGKTTDDIWEKVGITQQSLPPPTKQEQDDLNTYNSP